MADWIEWNGGECPVPAGTRVEVAMRRFPDLPGVSSQPETLRWTHPKRAKRQGGGDIIAYRLLPSPPKDH